MLRSQDFKLVYLFFREKATPQLFNLGQFIGGQVVAVVGNVDTLKVRLGDLVGVKSRDGSSATVFGCTLVLGGVRCCLGIGLSANDSRESSQHEQSGQESGHGGQTQSGAARFTGSRQ